MDLSQVRKELPQLQPRSLLRESAPDHRGIYSGAAGRSAADSAPASGNHPCVDSRSKREDFLEYATFWKGCNLIQFAASQKHIGLYPGPEAVEAFTDRLESFPTSKGTIRLPLNQPMPLDLIAEIARWCEKRNSK